MFFTTLGINKLIEEREIFFDDVYNAVLRFMIEDWGDLCEEDVKTQREYIEEYGYRMSPMLMGVYSSVRNKKFWVISNISEDWKGRTVTVLLPEEY